MQRRCGEMADATDLKYAAALGKNFLSPFRRHFSGSCRRIKLRHSPAQDRALLISPLRALFVLLPNCLKLVSIAS